MRMPQPFDSWHTLGASAQSRCRKIHIGVEIRKTVKNSGCCVGTKASDEQQTSLEIRKPKKLLLQRELSYMKLSFFGDF